MPDDGRTWSASARQVGSTWEVHVPALGVSGRAALLSEVEQVARDLVLSSGRPAAGEGAPRIAVHPVVPRRVRALLAAADRLRATPDSVAVEDVRTRRRLARELVDQGFPVADVAALLGVSEARVRLLAAGAPSSAPAAAQPTLPLPRPAPAAAPFRAPAPTPLPMPGGPSSVDPHRSSRHEALLHHGDDDFLARALPFLLEGVALGQPVLAALPEPRLHPLRRALGEAADRVHLVDMAELGRNPARILPAWLEFLDEHGGRGPVRGLGEPDWLGRTGPEVAEYQLHEALLNVAVTPDTPAWLRCAYDTQVVEQDVLDAALCSHPLVVEAGEPRGSTQYAGLAYVEELFGAPLPEPEAPTTGTAFGPGDLALVRTLAHRWCREAGLGRERASDVVLAVTELATNSVRHGGGTGRLRTWRESGGLVVEVSDPGRITDPLVGRRAPEWSQEGGRGLWLVNQLCDLVQLRSGRDGTVVRVFARTSA